MVILPTATVAAATALFPPAPVAEVARLNGVVLFEPSVRAPVPMFKLARSIALALSVPPVETNETLLSLGSRTCVLVMPPVTVILPLF